MIHTTHYSTNKFFTKEQLYKKIEKLRKLFELNDKDYPITPFMLLDKLSEYVNYEETGFHTGGLYGLLMRGERKCQIVINRNLTPAEKRFAITHEIIHLFCHDTKTKFMCLPMTAKINDSFEWQANEGAAELLLPYKIFINDFMQTLGHYEGNEIKAVAAMAKTYGLSEIVVNYRLNNLRYEFEQYFKGVPIDDIEILSRKKYLLLKAEGKNIPK